LPECFTQPRSPWAVPPLVTSAKVLSYHASQLTVNSREFTFRREDRDTDIGWTATLSLEVGGQLVFELFGGIEETPAGSEFNGGLVTAFIEGPWVNDFLAMVRQKEGIDKKALEGARDHVSEAERKRFGL
jgi:hypothetical protein